MQALQHIVVAVIVLGAVLWLGRKLIRKRGTLCDDCPACRPPHLRKPTRGGTPASRPQGGPQRAG